MTTQTVTPLGKVPDLAARLGVPLHRGYEIARARKVPGIVRIGRQIRVNMDVLEEWIASGGDGEDAGDGA